MWGGSCFCDFVRFYESFIHSFSWMGVFWCLGFTTKIFEDEINFMVVLTSVLWLWQRRFDVGVYCDCWFSLFCSGSEWFCWIWFHLRATSPLTWNIAVIQFTPQRATQIPSKIDSHKCVLFHLKWFSSHLHSFTLMNIIN